MIMQAGIRGLVTVLGIALPLIALGAASASAQDEPFPLQEPAEVEAVIVIGPRGGETLGEYRARAEHLFVQLDTDGDGRLSRDEIVVGVAHPRLRAALERADANLDEHVSRQEFADLVTRTFQRLDSDGDGVVTRRELEAGDILGDPPPSGT